MIAERVLMGVLLGGIAIGCAWILYPFFSAILWAAILVFASWPVFEWLRLHLRIGRGGAACVMVAITALVIVLPLALAVPGGADDVASLRRSINAWLLSGLPPAPDWLSAVPLFGVTLTDYWNTWSADLSAMENFFKPYLGIVAEDGLAVLLGFAGGVARFLMALFIAFFFWLYGEQMMGHLHSIMRRIAGDYAERLIEVTGRTVRGTVYGILGTAIIQGILTGFGLWVSGVPRPVLLGAVAAFLAVLPIGAPLVWIPAGIWLMGTGHTGWGVFLIVYGIVAVSGADHLIRPFFISRGARLPFLLVVLGVLGGVIGFGLLGIFLGPVLLGVAFTLVLEFARSGERRRVSSVWR
jgi:predicted PurR-regulated permease PerM